MAVLALDTATEVLSIALEEAGALSGERNVHAGRSHLEKLLPETVGLMSRCGFGFGDIEAVVIGVGPGTFSGLRVGIATARALAQALAVPIAPSCTLDALALGLADDLPSTYGGLLPVVDARRGQVFTRAYRIDDEGKPLAVSGIVCIDPEAVPDFAANHVEEPVLAGGNGATSYGERLTGKGIEFLAAEDRRNEVRAANHLPNADFIAYGGPESLLAVEPLYVREPDADKTVLLRKREPWLR